MAIPESRIRLEGGLSLVVALLLSALVMGTVAGGEAYDPQPGDSTRWMGPRMLAREIGGRHAN